MATEKQKRAAMHLMENDGNVSDAMRKAGYSDASVKNSHRLTRQKGFIEVLERAGVTEDKLAEVLSGGLDAKTEKGKADHAVRHRYLETGLKARRLITNDNNQQQVNPIAVILAKFGIESGEDIGELPTSTKSSLEDDS